MATIQSTTKQKVLQLFDSNKGIYFSGEDIAKKLSVSRSAVWKAVKSLRNDGYSIDAVTNRGYCLSAESDIISPQGIQKYLDSKCKGLDIAVFDSVTSTNLVARQKAEAGVSQGCVIIANEQEKGRGRLGRSFFSPANTGVYMSLLLRPENYTSTRAARLTTMAAVAMCEAIEAVSDTDAQIKWVNDIYIRGKKVCGILTEASFGLESGQLEYAVLGIGVNVYSPEIGFPEELEEIAEAVFHKPQQDAKNRITAEFLNRFMKYYQEQDKIDYIEKYRKRSFVIGKNVTVVSGHESKCASVIGINDECHLLVKYCDGREESLSSGEISIRL